MSPPDPRDMSAEPDVARSSQPAAKRGLGAWLPSVRLRTALLVGGLLPPLLAALMAGTLSAGFVQRNALQEARLNLSHDADGAVALLHDMADSLALYAAAAADRSSMGRALAGGEDQPALEMIDRTRRSLQSVGSMIEEVEAIRVDGSVLASTMGDAARGRFREDLIGPMTTAGEPDAQAFTRVIDDPRAPGSFLLAGNAPVMSDSEHVGWISLVRRVNAQFVSDLAKLSRRDLLLVSSDGLVAGTITVNPDSLFRQWRGPSETEARPMVLAGNRFITLYRHLNIPGSDLGVLLLWPQADVDRPGNLAVGAIVLSVLFVLFLVIPAVAFLGARLARRLHTLSVMFTELGEGRKSSQLASGDMPMIQELRDLRRATELFRENLAERERLTERLSWMANFDALTRLPNRALFQDRLQQSLAAAPREGRTIALLCLDLDRFKEVNDTLGHAAGDQLLRRIAERLELCIRSADTVARLGGDEFSILMPGIEGPEEAEMLARRVIGAISIPVELEGKHAEVGVSIGIALSDGSHAPATLQQEADVALYAAKAEGRRTWRFFEPAMNEAQRRRRALEAALREGLHRNEFSVVYQPQVNLSSGRLTGAEALLRWQDSSGTRHSPADFVPLAEDTGLILPIGEFVLAEACRFGAVRPSLLVAVNASAVQLREPGFARMVERTLQQTGMSASRLEIEMTETAILRDMEAVMSNIRLLRHMGVRIALDDFGTGFSSLSHLRQLECDRIKIDRSFVKEVAEQPQARAMVRAMVGMAKAVGVELIGEGVETPAQARALREEECAEAQGFLFGAPVSAEEFDRLRLDRGELASVD
ncbi:EAL domain-containing protein [Rhodovarius crocodyli]|uniref:EAL domain-containing protein n=1 Tax=Rhodovarius crocodyli TaxID=1979269 RepID=A0A437M344_9PROT|nr:EAL domain-containing protein [Rhodovarius crocodyli]RVT91943.1 EAL domain-containing protein [Rhodovarius crocodyli]